LAQDLGLEGKVAIVAGGGARGDGIGNGRAAAICRASIIVHMIRSWRSRSRQQRRKS